MTCTPYECRMTMASCIRNQHIAWDAMDRVLSEEESETLFQLEDYEVSRMIICGKCKWPERMKVAFRRAVGALADKISRFDEWGWDPERSAIQGRESKARYREAHRDEITERSENRRRDQRIETLRKKIGGKDHDN